MDSQGKSSSNLLDNHNRLIADILTRYRTLTMLATVHAEGERNNANPETIAVAGISMKMEFEGLYSSIKELLTLSRKIKELWVFGPLGKEDPDRQAKEKQIDEDVAQVSRLLNKIEALHMTGLAEENGGTWQPLKKDEPEATVAPAPKEDMAGNATTGAAVAAPLGAAPTQ